MDNGQNPRMGIEPQRHRQVKATQLFVDHMHEEDSEETQSAYDKQPVICLGTTM